MLNKLFERKTNSILFCLSTQSPSFTMETRQFYLRCRNDSMISLLDCYWFVTKRKSSWEEEGDSKKARELMSFHLQLMLFWYGFEACVCTDLISSWISHKNWCRFAHVRVFCLIDFESMAFLYGNPWCVFTLNRKRFLNYRRVTATASIQSQFP